MDQCIAARTVVASREVLEELQRKADDLFKWVKERAAMFVEIDEATEAAVIEIMAKFPKFVDERTTKSAADPFVIALACSRVPPLTVVTEEQGGTDEKPRIPHVCRFRGVRPLSLLEFIREMGWRFG